MTVFEGVFEVEVFVDRTRPVAQPTASKHQKRTHIFVLLSHQLIFLTVELDRLIADRGLRNAGNPDVIRVEHFNVEWTASYIDVGISHCHHMLPYRRTQVNNYNIKTVTILLLLILITV